MTAAPDPSLPPALRPGDRVALVAPAGPAPAELVARSEELVRAWGLEPVVYPGLRARHPRADYLSGGDEDRARDLQDAWCDPEVAGVFCVRGGYGTVRVLDLLDVAAMRAAVARRGVVPLFGSSDLTALHEWLRERVGVPTWFTPMLATASLLDDEAATASLRAAALGPGPFGYTWPGAESLVPGRAEGVLVGGNLSLLAMTLGERGRGPLDHRGALVLLEDVTEETYKLDGSLPALLRAGGFDGVAGVVCGSWQACSPAEEIRALVREALGGLGVPIAWELGFGHGPGAPSVPLGVRAVLDAPAGVAPRLDVTARRPAPAAAR